ncbi:MAG TPA: 3TM-type holin [Methanosarcinales archaeon]|jgi:hypothetical protein|nr:3TM-type holin [Methanosarcinales archaeon]|tara:strand:+ start:23 stop:427 length:405 start_codon:yes stop_codon:yes gene_type:complete
MNKIFAWLTGSVIKEVGNVIDKFTTTKEEKLEANRQIQIILETAEANAQREVTSRWESDMNSDSWLAKNIRPMVLVYLTFIFTLLAFTDGNIGEFKIAKEYIPIIQTLLVTAYGAYFVGRSWEKGKQIMNNKNI